MSTPSTTSTVTLTMTSQGLQPQSPASILQQLIAGVSATTPGYTASLPGTLIEDISSTDVFAITLCDSALVELVNSIAPGTANPYITTLLGDQFGITQGVGYNTNVNAVFNGPPGFVINKGFIVTDGTYQYVVQNPVIIPTSGQTGNVYCLANQSGSWAVPINSVTQFVSSVPGGVSLTVTNPNAGTPGAGNEPIQAYQARVYQAGLATCQGMTTTTRNAIQAVPGVQANLVSVLQKSGQWEVLVGGGDPYQVAFAIFQGIGDIANLVGSTLTVANITQANPGVVTTNLNHGYTTGQVVQINGIVGMTQLNAVNLTITVTGLQTFSVGVNTSGYGAYVSGGVVTPNLRNTSVNILDYPDTYTIPIVNPPQQTVGITVTWNTLSTNFVSPAAVSALATPALVNYVNTITVGKPLNLFDMQLIFQDAIQSILPPSLLTRLIFAITVNGISTSPTVGTGIIPGDPESYFFTTAGSTAINQG
jgi:hypothetical protein